MSDVCDRAEGCAAVEAMGGVFLSRRPIQPAGSGPLPPCECGGRPGSRPLPPLRNGQPCETLACGTCGNAVGPMSARQALAMAWRLGGWMKEEGGGRRS